MWQALRETLKPRGLEIVTVGLDVLGAEGCRDAIEAAQPRHPSLIDSRHVLANLFGVINIPSSVWIDEQGMIVRPAEVAPAPPISDPESDARRQARMGEVIEKLGTLPRRFMEMGGEVARMVGHQDEYHAALLDWVERGAASPYAHDPDTVIARSRPRSADVALGHAHFELACALEQQGDHAAAVPHFREAHRLVPDSWTFRRQAWSIERSDVAGTPMERFWQGPSQDDPDAWPYDGGWLEDVREVGPENYNNRWEP